MMGVQGPTLLEQKGEDDIQIVQMSKKRDRGRNHLAVYVGRVTTGYGIVINSSRKPSGSVGT
jgi:hypothetical protein